MSPTVDLGTWYSSETHCCCEFPFYSSLIMSSLFSMVRILCSMCGVEGVCVEGVCVEGVCVEGVCVEGVCVEGVCVEGVCVWKVCVWKVCVWKVCVWKVCGGKVYVCVVLNVCVVRKVYGLQNKTKQINKLERCY